MLQQDGNDMITTWNPSPKEKENSKKNGLECAPIEVRIIKVKLKTGETELLVTSLVDQKKYSIEDINLHYSSLA